MNYSLKKYHEVFCPDISLRTLQRKVSNDQLPSNHHVCRSAKNVVFVGSENSYKAYEYQEACYEFHKVKDNYSGTQIELCVELSIKYDIGLTKLTKMLGV